MRTEPLADAYLAPSRPAGDRFARAVWQLAWWTLFRPSPRPLHAWRSWLLRCFGARVGRDCHVYPGARIWAPWNLVCEDVVAVADGAEIYNPATVTLRSHCIVSQGAYLCGATHDYDDPAFPMRWAPIEVGAYAWVAARAAVQCGVRVGEGAVVALGAVVTRDVEPWTVCAGVPARRIGVRRRRSAHGAVAAAGEAG